jgi:NAD(P)-dependent dehydrogenase (short-subunit alcohol dehydrogenase family)
VKLKGKTILIIGASSALGFEMARLFAFRGTNEILVCHGKEKGEKAVSTIKNEVEGVSLDLMVCDLASMI